LHSRERKRKSEARVVAATHSHSTADDGLLQSLGGARSIELRHDVVALSLGDCTSSFIFF
jgi:hypothetical protein